MRNYKSMELSDEDKLDGIIPSIARTPDYPYGLKIALEEPQLVTLEVEEDDEPEKGDLLHFAAFARVTSFSKVDGRRRVELQIESISCVEDESTESDEE